MIRINCPFCGERDHSEFSYGGDASVKYPPLDAPAEQWLEAVFQRENIDGVQFETWQHLQGCRMWSVVERDTTNQRFTASDRHMKASRRHLPKVRVVTYEHAALRHRWTH